jgi:hypothetical protein
MIILFHKKNDHIVSLTLEWKDMDGERWRGEKGKRWREMGMER